MPVDLWRYFAEDFFHDGSLSRLRMQPERRRVRFDVECPNVKRLKADGDFAFVNVAYRVSIGGVWSVDLRDGDEDGDGSTVKVLAAEIEAEDDEIAAASRHRDEPHHSLTLHTDRYWLTAVFSDLRVTPLEEAAVELMLADRRFSFPFSPD